METRSFVIIAENKSNVELQLEKLNRRAKKLGLEEITSSWGKAFVETREVLFQDPNYPDLPSRYIKKELLVIPVDITGPLNVSYEGWQFIATLQHLPTGENIIRSISDEFEIPKQYRTAGSDCHHCHIKRYRKDTYLVRDDTTGVILQIGSTCIKSFLGGNSPDDLMNKANFIAELLSYMEGSGGSNGCGSGESLFHIELFLATTAACVRHHGWLSKTKANLEGGIPTSTWVQNNLIPPMGFKATDFSVVTDADKVTAKQAAEWVENLTDTECDSSDYLHNIRAIARSGMVGYRSFGFAASIIAAYNRAMYDRMPKAQSGHVGVVKQRLVFDLTLNKHFSFDSMYGTKHKFIFTDTSGNVLTWTTTSAPRDLVEGNRYVIKGTIKEHSEYKSVPQTILNRCEILSMFPNTSTAVSLEG